MRLKNPIQPILGLSNRLMKHKPSDEKEFQNIIKIINRNAKKLIQLQTIFWMLQKLRLTT